MGTAIPLRINGRSSTLYAPTGIAANAPLVICLHPGGDNATVWRATCGLDAEADSGLFYVLYVNGNGNPTTAPGIKTWFCGNSPRYQCCGYAGDIHAKDTEYIKLLIEDLPTRYSIDTSKIFLAAYSNGGMLSYSVMARYPSSIAGATIIAGTYIGVRGECSASVPVKIMHIYGTSDSVVPPAGGSSSESDGYNENALYIFPAITDWQGFLTGKGATINNVVLNTDHTFTNIQTALGSDNFASRVGDMVSGTGTWA